MHLPKLTSNIFIYVGAFAVAIAATVGLKKAKESEGDPKQPKKGKKTKKPKKEKKAKEDNDGNSKRKWKDMFKFHNGILRPPGLVNEGNSCFANSYVQAVAACPSFDEYLDHLAGKICTVRAEAGKSQDLSVTEALHELTSSLNKLSKAPAAQRTTRLSSALIRANPGNAWLFNRQQQDAQELLQAVSTAIADEEEVAHAALESIAPMKDLKGATQDTSIVSCGGYQPELPPRLRNPQAGLTANLISCQICNFTSTTKHESFDNLQLKVPPNMQRCNVEELLRFYAQPEPLAEYACPGCSVMATRMLLQQKIAAQDEVCHKIVMRRTGRDTKGKKVEELDKRLKKETKTLKALKSSLVALDDATKHNVEAQLPEDVERMTVASQLSNKQILIASAPQCLTLHLDRSVYTKAGFVMKNPCQIVCKEYLDLGPYCTVGADGKYIGQGTSKEAWEAQMHKSDSQASPSEEPARLPAYPYLYGLKAIECHGGSHYAGHYYTYRRVSGDRDLPRRSEEATRRSEEGRASEDARFHLPRKLNRRRKSTDSSSTAPRLSEDDTSIEDRWFRISDQLVEPVKGLEEIMAKEGSNIHMLFYEKVRA